MILPMAVALAIAVFAGGIYTTAADWRASEAATTVGADTAFTTGLSLARAVALTHELDPGGRWLMAAGADSDISGPTAVVDAPRLARVGVWPASWTPGVSVSTIASRLSPLRPPLRLTGRRLQITVDNEVSGGGREILVGVELAAPFGQVRQIFVGPFPHGRSTLGASSRYCLKGCVVSGLSLSGPGTLAQPMRGVLTISNPAVDGRAVPYFAGVGWRPRYSGAFADGPSPVSAAETSGDSLTVRLDSAARKVVAELAPQDLPVLSPALMGRKPDLTVVARRDGKLQLATAVGGKTVVDPFATSESMPFFGPAGMLVDYTTYSSEVFDLLTTVHILARADTPSSVLAALAGDGINQRVTLVQVRHDLDQDAYALALNLYLVVTLIVLLLAFAGLAVTMAVEIPSRRRDAASLRVVGVPRRSILAAVVLDCGAILGTAAVAGIFAGVLSQYLVVRTLTLGYADDIFTPRVLPSLDLLAVVELLLASFAVMLCLAVILGGLTIRGARTATLREGG
jgi:putative ABC transport system permease protein